MHLLRLDLRHLPLASQPQAQKYYSFQCGHTTDSLLCYSYLLLDRPSTLLIRAFAALCILQTQQQSLQGCKITHHDKGMPLRSVAEADSQLQAGSW